jgi:two-component system, OmpR family, phosphate regulon sensor histidine kinase PhoR
MTHRIFAKLILTCVGLLAVAALGVDQLVTRVSTNDLRADLERELLEKAELARTILEGKPVEQYQAIANDVGRTVAARVTAIRADGTVLADSEADAHAMENHSTRPEFIKALHGETGTSSRPSHTLHVDFLYVAIPIRGGALRLALPLKEIDARIRQIRSKILQMTLLALIPAIFLAAWIARRVSNQFSNITAFSNELATGNFQASPPRFAGGELGALGRTLSGAAGHLRSMFEQLQEERSRFAAAINGIGEGILVADRKLRVILFNPAMEQMFPTERLSVGMSLDQWSQQQVSELFGQVLAEGRSCSVELTTHLPVERSWKVSCAPITSPKGKVQAVVAVFYDITELERVDRMRKDFVINVSHELRTPLAAIQGYAETLLDGAIDEPETNRRFVKILWQNAERLAQLTSDLMTLSQIEVNAREFTFLPHSVKDLLVQSTDSIRTLTEKKQIRVQVDAVAENLELECDPGAIHQIMNNLLDNAAKYTSDGGQITVGARRSGHEVEFYVRDTGIGITAEHIPRLFERFYRVDKARSRALGGTGLGLAIVKHLVLAHHGSVRVESQVGVGSTFYFHIPLAFVSARSVVEARQGVLF